MRKEDKRGLTLLKFIQDLVIGIICLIILFSLLSAIMNIFFFSDEKQKAQATIDRLAQYLEITPEGGSTSFLFSVPKNWWFVSISNGVYADYIKLSGIDKKCAGKNCICICRDGFGFLNNIDCSGGRNSVCEIVSRPFFMDGKPFAFKITLASLTITKQTNAYLVGDFLEYPGVTSDENSYTFEGLSPPDTTNFNDGLANMQAKGYEPIIESTAKAVSIEPALAKAIAIKENVRMDPTEISSSGAVGIMQIKPDTAKKTKEELFIPEINIEAGILEMVRIKDNYLDGNLDSLSKIELLAIGYHDGPAVIDGYQGYVGCKNYEFPSSSKCERYTWYLSEAAKQESINYPRVVLAYYQKLKDIEKGIPNAQTA